jgi:hypothetical protein
MSARSFLFTSESVTEGHPDKVADQVSDAVLDAVLRDDPAGRVACETLVTTGLVVVAGEITTSTYVDVSNVVRETIRGIGYTDSAFGFDANTCGVVREDRVEDTVRDLVGDLVRMPFGDRLGSEEMPSLTAHAVLLARRTVGPARRSMVDPRDAGVKMFKKGGSVVPSSYRTRALSLEPVNR